MPFSRYRTQYLAIFAVIENNLYIPDKVHHIPVICPDYERSSRFCTDVPGMEVFGGVVAMHV